MAAKKRKKVSKAAADGTPAQSSNFLNTNGVFFGWKPELPDHRDLPYAAMRLALEKPVTLPAWSIFTVPYRHALLTSTTALLTSAPCARGNRNS